MLPGTDKYTRVSHRHSHVSIHEGAVGNQIRGLMWTALNGWLSKDVLDEEALLFGRTREKGSTLRAAKV